MTVFAEEMTQPRDAIAERRVLALIAGLVALAGPRRTRPLAGVLYGVALSRVHGAAQRRAQQRVDDIEQRHAKLNAEYMERVPALWADRELLAAVAARSDRLTAAVFGGDPLPDPDNDSGAQG